MATRNINILVVGATGKQGGAVIRALRGMGRDDITVHVLALTRNVESDGAKALLAERYKGLVDLVQGDITKPEPIFASQPQGSIDAVFLVTTPGKMPEDQQAIPFIDAAVEHGVKHIVFSSVERGGDEKSWTNPTDIKHFREKHNIEIHIRDKAKKEPAKFTWTIIRPVAFMDNWNGGFFGAAFSALLSVTLKPDTKLQLVSVHDIGRFASAALIFPGKWAGRAFGLAGDALTLDEAKKAFQSVVGLERKSMSLPPCLPILWGK